MTIVFIDQLYLTLQIFQSIDGHKINFNLILMMDELSSEILTLDLNCQKWL